jgi:hypothetical protein
MRVRILSGNYAGCVRDVPQVEGECLLATGFAELAPPVAVEPPPAPVDSAPVDEPPIEEPVVTEPPSAEPAADGGDAPSEPQ